MAKGMGGRKVRELVMLDHAVSRWAKKLYARMEELVANSEELMVNGCVFGPNLSQSGVDTVLVTASVCFVGMVWVVE